MIGGQVFIRAPPRGGYDIIVYVDGATTKAEDANGKILYTGTNTAVFQSALNYLSGGGTLYLASDITITATVSITSLSDIAIVSAHGVLINKNTTANLPGLKIDRCANILVDGPHFKAINDGSAYTDVLVDIYGSTNVHINNCTFSDHISGVRISAYAATPVRAVGIYVTNCDFYNYRYVNVSVGNGCDDVIISGNLFHDFHSDAGIADQRYSVTSDTVGTIPAAPWSTNIQVTGNHFWNHTGPQPGSEYYNCIDMHGGMGITVTGNFFSNMLEKAIFLHNHAAIEADPFFDWHITDNVISDTGIGINVNCDGSTIDNVVISGNQLRNITNMGIIVNTSASGAKFQNVAISDNVITDFKTGMYIYPSTSGTTFKNFVISGNILQDNTNASIEILADNSTVDHFIISNNITEGTTYGYCTGISFTGTSATMRNVSIIDNIINGISSGTRFDIGIKLTGDPDGAEIRGNNLYWCTYGIYTSIVDGAVIIDNTILDATTGIYILKGTNDIIANNRVGCTTGININRSDAISTYIHDNRLGESTTKISKSSAVTPVIRANQGYLTEAEEVTVGDIADGGTIPHGLVAIPTKYGATATIASEFVSITAVDGTNLTVAIKKDTGAAGTSQNIAWWAKV